jgi:nucleoid DNA-binding protein
MIPFILKALQNENRVFIERLGSFRIQMRHAEIDGDIVRPPFNEVVFTPNDSEENNFSLANQISRDKQCLFTEANEQITAWVDELLAALQNNKSVTYEGFGSFMLDKKGNISFESMVIPQLNSLFEGFEPLNIRNFGQTAVAAEEEPEVEEAEPQTTEEPVVAESDSFVAVADDHKENIEEVKEEEEKEVENVVADDEMDVKEEEQETEDVKVEEPEVEEEKEEEEPEVEVEKEEEEPESEDEKEEEKEEENEKDEKEGDDDDEEDDDDDDDDDDDEKDKRKHHKLAWLWVILLLFIVLGVLGYIFKDKLLNIIHQWKDKKQPVEQPVVPSDSVNESTVDYTDSLAQTEPAEESVETTETPEPEVYTPEVIKKTADSKYDYIQFEPGHFYAIAGSFPSEADVVRHIRQKHLDQYSPVIVKQDGVKNLRVCIGVFDTEAEAEQFAKGVSSQYWVLK